MLRDWRAIHALSALVALLVSCACGGEDAPTVPPRARAGLAPAAPGVTPTGGVAARAQAPLDPSQAAPLALRRAFEPQPGFTALGKHKPGEWLDHFDEPGQSVAQFERAERVVPSAERRTIMILP